MYQFFLSGNNFVVEKLTEKTLCHITNWGISKPWIWTQPIVTKVSLCYWKNTVTLRYKHIFHQLFLLFIWKVIWKTQRKKVLTSVLYLHIPEKLSKRSRSYSTAGRCRQRWSIKFDTIRIKRNCWGKRLWNLWWVVSSKV